MSTSQRPREDYIGCPAQLRQDWVNPSQDRSFMKRAPRGLQVKIGEVSNDRRYARLDEPRGDRTAGWVPMHVLDIGFGRKVGDLAVADSTDVQVITPLQSVNTLNMPDQLSKAVAGLLSGLSKKREEIPEHIMPQTIYNLFSRAETIGEYI